MKNKKTLYDKLGVDESSSQEDIKKAYRKKAKENHPDNGGDKETMTELALAYNILSNNEKRKKYDETGNENIKDDFTEKYYTLINTLFMSIVEENHDIAYRDLINEFKIKLRNAKTSIKKAITITEDRIRKLNEILNRISSKKDQSIILILKNNIEEAEKAINRLKDELIFTEKVIEVVNDYNYKFELKTTNTIQGWHLSTDL